MRLASPLALLLVLAPVPALAQARPDFPLAPGITVAGSATVKTTPDIATIKVELRGEGKTADAASTDLASRQRAVIGGLAKLDPKLTYTTSAAAITEVRRGDCAESPGDVSANLAMEADALAGGNDDARKGPCRITGYVASISATVDLSKVDVAGTAIGLAERQGAASASLDGFRLRDPAAATRSAVAAAMADAKTQAASLASASGVKLGPIVSVMGAPDQPTVMVAEKLVLYDAPAVAPAPPVVIDVSPQPVETHAQVLVVFSLEK